MVLPADEEPLRSRRRCRHQDLAHRVRGEKLELGPRFDDVDVAVLAREVEPSIGGDRRRAEGAARDAVLIDALSGLGPISGEDSVVLAGVKKIPYTMGVVM